MKRHLFWKIVAAILFVLLGDSQVSLLADTEQVIALSREGRPLRVKKLGQGPVSLVLIGGIHGGYEWNTVLLTRQLFDYFAGSPEEIHPGVSLFFLENMNPDGMHKVTKGADPELFNFTGAPTGRGRTNAGEVDLNRNWDSNWHPEARWGRFTVSGGSHPFSEPETRGVRDFLLDLKPESVIFYHSAANGIYYGGSRDGNRRGLEIALAYSEGSGYPVSRPVSEGGTGGSLVSYPITGAASNYLFHQGVNSMAVELVTHQDIEFSRNLQGVKTVMQFLSDSRQGE